VIYADATTPTFAAFDLSYLGWYRFNVPAVGAPPTTINSTTSDETAFYDQFSNHLLLTSYTYNATNQVTQQLSPDGGTNRYWYDLLSRLVISQNDKQLPLNNYSYTTYDPIGRITEVGQKNYTGTSIGTPNYLINTVINSFNAAGTNSQVTDTYYDSPVPTVAGNTNGIATLPGQSNLRKRVAASTYTETQGSPALRATYYNYDIDGNVKTIWQQVNGLYQNSTNTGLKRIDYEYDLVSGKVNFVRYQDTQPDAFYYQYSYDADNRLTNAQSGIAAMVDTLTHSQLLPTTGKQDAAYSYYLHGPLRRMELGDINSKVQGVDYAYTLQGWLKGVNSATGTPTADMGQDGITAARDAYGYSLGYYTNDYKPIGGTSYGAFALKYTATTGDITGQSLYNGNISNTTLAINQLGSPVGYTYHYDQLNRMKKMRQYTGISGTSWSRANITLNYQENVTYDGNGNILTYGRNGAAPTAQTIDSLIYRYNTNPNGTLNNNRIRRITDAIANSNYTGDITNQTLSSNYHFDAIGNLIYDYQSGITGNDGVNSITWSVYGKIESIYKTTGTISYTYNPGGERVSKTANGLTTYYIRDAQGNTLALYDNAGSNVNWREQDLYGSSRLGLWTPNVNLATNNATAVWDTTGDKEYELDNHLGNVLETITEKRLQHSTDGINIDYYNADIATAQDYYPFGMLMPGRQYSFTKVYRYGFNGQERSDEINGAGNHNTAEFWEYDTRAGIRWNIDPKTAESPGQSPYAVFNSSPILYADPTGESGIATIDKSNKTITVSSIYVFYGSQSSPQLAKQIAKNIEDAFNNAHGTIKIDGTTYKVQFKVTGVDLSKSKNVEYFVNNNKDPKMNYFKLEKSTDLPYGNSYTDGTGNGANTGFWSTNQMKDNKGTTESHEYNHGLGGLNHPELLNPNGGNHDQEPSIDMTINSYNFVKSMYLDDANGLDLDVTKRKVTQKNIDAIINKDVIENLKDTGESTVGGLTNDYH